MSRSKFNWKDEKEKIISYLKEKKSIRKIARIYGVHHDTIENVIKKYNISVSKEEIISKELLIKYLIEDGKTLTEIAKLYNTTHSTISRIIKTYGINYRSNRGIDFNNYRSIFRELFIVKNYSTRDIAEKFGFSISTIKRYLKKFGIFKEKEDLIKKFKHDIINTSLVPIDYYNSIYKRNIISKNNKELVYVPESGRFIVKDNLISHVNKLGLDYTSWYFRWNCGIILNKGDEDWIRYHIDLFYSNKLFNTKLYIIGKLRENINYKCNFLMVREDFIDLYYKSREENNLPIFKYDFSKLPKEIKTCETKVSIVCLEKDYKYGNIIGEWQTTFNLFIRYCKDHKRLGRKKFCETMRFTNKEFLIKLESLYGNDYTCLDSYVDSDTPIRLRCNNCGCIFSITPHELWRNRNHLDIEKFCKCPKCRKSHVSIGEESVIKWLNNNNILYIRNDPNRNIKGKILNLVRIDFQIIYNGKTIWIEYNGIQHYMEVKHFHRNNKGETFNDQLRRDQNVRDYCKENNIILIEIPYTYNTYKKVKELLDRVILGGEDINTIIDYSSLYKN